MESKRLKEEGSSTKLKLRCLGLCGVDESFEKADEFAWPSYVEWGVLFRPEKEGSLRFPKDDYVQRFTKGKHHLAAHLCSTRCLEFLQGDLSFVQRLHAELGFKRFQINATKANNFDSDSIGEAHVNNIVNAAKVLPHAEFIVQRNTETRGIWERLESMGDAKPHNISYLFDASVGRGVVLSEFAKPTLESALYGYAGGLKPENIEQVLREIAKAVPHGVKVWIDMESGIRDKEGDRFSAERAWGVCKVVEALIAEGLIEIEEDTT